MRMTIENDIKTTLLETNDAKTFMKNVEECFRSTDKYLVRTLMANLTTLKFDGSRSMHEHVLKMTNLFTKLNALGMTLSDAFLV